MKLLKLRRRPHGRGQTLVEFALILPIFILVLVGIFDFGRAIYAYNTLSNAAREAVRVGIVNQNCNVIGTEASDRASSLGISWQPSGNPCTDVNGNITIQFLNPDGTTPTGSDTCVEPDGEPGVPLGCMVQVTVNYEYNAATPIISNLVGTIDLSATTHQAVEFEHDAP